MTHWFEAQQITYPDGAEGKPLKIFPLAGSCYADKKDMQPRILTELWNTALRGESPPAELLSRAVRRNRAEGDISRPRAALMQMILRYTAKGGEIMEQHVAYHCGKLLAELEAVQEAVRGKGNTNVERHFGMASTTPATAFGMLLRLSQPHMSTLRRDKPHLAPILQGRIEEITAEIGTEFPSAQSGDLLGNG